MSDPTTTVARGRQFEAFAEQWLEARGLKRLDRNFNARGGELDLVMRDGASVVFVEVRYRATSRMVGALESVTVAKQGRIVLAATLWLQRHPQYASVACRFDVIGIEGAEPSCHVTWIKQAFTA
jgi:putative endonuclease